MCSIEHSDNSIMYKLTCLDIDECTLEGPERHNCDVNATCINTVGSFNCSCNPGYRGNGTSCQSKILVLSLVFCCH